MRRSPALLIASTVLSIAVPAGPPAAAASDRATAQTYTPVIQDVLASPRWYRGIDNRVHVEYELRLINGFPVAATVTEIEVRRGGGAPIAELTGERLLVVLDRKSVV